MLKGTVVLVLDCGGGTVDITVHRLTSDPVENFLCEEILPSSGGCEWGSKYVDKYFEEFLREFFGQELYEIYLKNAIARLEILKHFEMLKRKFNPGQDDRSRLQLSYLSEDLTPSKLTELTEKHNSKHPNEFHLKQRGTSCIDLPPALMISFFQPLFENIKSKVEQLLEQSENKVGYKAKFIFMVGGFSESPYLKSEIKKRCKIMITKVDIKNVTIIIFQLAKIVGESIMAIFGLPIMRKFIEYNAVIVKIPASNPRIFHFTFK
jgi:molecular chaperone DnaK (HSP70)